MTVIVIEYSWQCTGQNRIQLHGVLASASRDNGWLLSIFQCVLFKDDLSYLSMDTWLPFMVMATDSNQAGARIAAGPQLT